jgi:hypothetical protein
MKAMATGNGRTGAAELKIRIVQLQELAATLAREGDAEGAKAARAKLYILLNQADLLNGCSPSSPGEEDKDQPPP